MENKEKVLVHRYKNNTWRVYKDGKYEEKEEVFLQDVQFVIIPELQVESRETKKRITHAFALGYETKKNTYLYNRLNWEDFNYDVYTNDNFVILASGKNVYSAEYVHLGPHSKKLSLPRDQ